MSCDGGSAKAQVCLVVMARRYVTLGCEFVRIHSYSAIDFGLTFSPRHLGGRQALEYASEIKQHGEPGDGCDCKDMGGIHHDADHGAEGAIRE